MFKDTLIKNRNRLATSAVLGILLTIIIGLIYPYSVNLTLVGFRWAYMFTNIIALIIIGILYLIYPKQNY